MTTAFSVIALLVATTVVISPRFRYTIMINFFHGNPCFHFAKTRLLTIVIEVNNKMEDEAVASDNIVTEFATYEDFLDSQITPLDLYYLEVIFRIYLVLWLVIVIENTTLSWEK